MMVERIIRFGDYTIIILQIYEIEIVIFCIDDMRKKE